MWKPLYALTVIIIIFSSGQARAQCVVGEHAFGDGEKVFYEVSYNWGFIWVNAGEVYFKTNTVKINDKYCYLFDSYGTSYRFYDWVFKVRDHFQSEVEVENFRPVWFTRNIYEGGYQVNNRYDFDFENQLLFSRTENSDKPKTIDTLVLHDCTFDVLSAIYYARTIDFSNYSIGDTIPIRFVIDGDFFELYIRYLGRENKKTRDLKVFECFKFSAMLVEGTIFKGGEDLLVWVTADKNKIPIMVEAKILIGSIKAYITGYENLKYEISEVY